MATFLVKHDFKKYTPSSWNSSYKARFGEKNDGFKVEAIDLTDCRRILSTKHNLNCFYLDITEVKS